jgi:hypothetical protein
MKLIELGEIKPARSAYVQNRKITTRLTWAKLVVRRGQVPEILRRWLVVEEEARSGSRARDWSDRMRAQSEAYTIFRNG